MFDLPHNFGDYTLVAFIGRTRGGILYQAIQQGMDRSVFLELLNPDNPEGGRGGFSDEGPHARRH